MQYSRVRSGLVIIVITTLCLAAWPAFAETSRPADVPDLLDPAIRALYVPLSVKHFHGDPDFPALLLANVARDFPQFLFVIVDARNGKETWSFQEDAVIFYLLFADQSTIRQGFLDEGFATTGKPSGQFIAGGPEATDHLLARLRESHKRFRELTRFTPAAWPSR